MANMNSVTTIIRLVRALLKDRLRTDGRDTYQFVGLATFTLTEDYPSSSTIKVYKNGTIMSSGYTYNSSTNILTISAMLATNDIILVTYNYYDKYSDAELTDYIESALLRFSQFGYKKTFKMSDDRSEVLTINGLSATTRECYEVSIVTSIEIDPQNVEIRTKDFTITALEKESKSDLITKALMQFTVWFGEITFEEDYRSDVV
jgi:hypothetical protein